MLTHLLEYTRMFQYPSNNVESQVSKSSLFTDIGAFITNETSKDCIYNMWVIPCG